MFANEEFDLDEDFLNDISQKESQYYSQTLPSDEERCVKKFKNDGSRSGSSYSETISNFKEPLRANSQENISGAAANELGSDKTVRTNSILERLKRHKTINPSSNVVSEKMSPTSNAKTCNLVEKSGVMPRNNDSRKNLILEIFKRNNVESSSAGPCSSDIKSITNNDNDGIDNRRIEQCKTVEKSFTKSAKPIYKPFTLVRQFPGPAGLLPDLSSSSVPQALLELSHSDESNDCTDIDVANDTSVVSNYYSQNTTNLFNDGPWQSLIDDLSDGFLNGHEISIIKQKVLTNSYKNNKVPFLAGIVQKVDFSRPDPMVMLKDCTGTIEGTICKDILMKYPHSLDIGAVLFLGNVGLLTVGSYLKKFHVIVTIKNIVNIYAGKTKIFETSEMKARLEDMRNDSQFSERVLNKVSNSNYSLNSKYNSRPNIENVSIKESRNSGLNSRNSNNSYCSLNTSSNHTGKNVNDNVRQSVVSNKIPAFKNNKASSDYSLMNNGKRKSLETKNVDNKITKSSFETDNFEDFDDDFTASFLDIDDNLISETATEIVSSVDKVSNKESTVISKENTVPYSVNFNATRNLNVRNADAKKSEKAREEAIANEKPSPSKSSKVKLKLSVFRSNSELTPPQGEDIESTFNSENNPMNPIEFQKQDNKNQVQSNSISDLLLNKENDSDEEIFSQLDIESIVSNYNSLNNVN